MSDLFSSVFPLKRGRVHEAHGPAATAFAAIACGMAARAARAPVLWLSGPWGCEGLNPLGLLPYCDPAALLMARAPDQAELLGVMEEALRSGAVALVVAETHRPLSLTVGRRLQLAAEAGRVTGLCLVPEGMGSNAAQTRWHCAAQLAETADSTLWRWSLNKNKMGTTANWDLRWDETSHRIALVSEARGGTGLAGAAALGGGALRAQPAAGQRAPAP